MEDHHVDRPGVEAQQCVKLTGTNSSIGFIALIIPVHPNKDEQDTTSRSGPQSRQRPFVTAQFSNKENQALALRRPGGHGGEKCTRSHPELGRETPQRQWYSVSRRGRVGRRQACQRQVLLTQISSQQHNELQPKTAPQTNLRGCCRLDNRQYNRKEQKRYKDEGRAPPKRPAVSQIGSAAATKDGQILTTP